MNESQYRAWRTRLRQVTVALLEEAAADGAARAQIGVMDCVIDPQRPERGYVTPRHGAVWVPDAQVRAALDELQAMGSPPRLRLLDGLYPPAFVAAMRELGLQVADERPLLLCPLDFEVQPAEPTWSARPVLVPEDARAWAALAGSPEKAPAGARDWLLTWAGEPVGAARFGAVGGQAARLHRWHAAGPAQDPAQASLLLTAACATPALGVNLLFAEAGTPAERDQLRALGFRDTGAILTLEGSR